MSEVVPGSGERAERTERALSGVRAEAFHVAAANVSDALLVTTPSDDGGAVVWVNTAFERLTGWSSDDMMGRSPLLLVGPETDTEIVSAATSAMLEGEDVQAQLVLHARDGSPFVVEARYVALWSDPRSNLWILRDLSDVTATELALRRTEQWARAIIENTDDVLIVTDGEGAMTYVGASIERVLGFEADELQGRSCFELVHPDDLRRVLADFGDEVRGTAARTPTELRGLHADGGWRHLSVLATNLLDQPSVQGVVLNCRDISRHRAVSDLLSEQSTVLERVARGMPLEDTLAAVIHLVEGRVPGAVCSIGQLDDSGRVRITVAPSMPPSVVAAIDDIPASSTLGRSLRAPVRRRSSTTTWPRTSAGPGPGRS